MADRLDHCQASWAPWDTVTPAPPMQLLADMLQAALQFANSLHH